MAEESSETRVVREAPDVLRMTKRRVLKEDGRYLIYYDFQKGPASSEKPKKEGAR